MKGFTWKKWKGTATLPLAGVLLLAGVNLAGPRLTSAALLVGNGSIQTGPDSDAPGLAEAVQYTATTSGTVSALSLYLDAGNAATSVEVGLYSNGAGAPGAILTKGVITAPQASRWNIATVPSVAVTAGTKYWLALVGEGGTVAFRDVASGGGPSQNSSQSALTALPSSWSGGMTYANSPASFYASGISLATTATPSPTATAAPSSQTITGVPCTVTLNGTQQSGTCTGTFTAATATPSPTATAVPSPTATASPAPQPTATATPSPTASPGPQGTSANCAGTKLSATPDYAALDGCGFPSPNTVGVPKGTTLTKVENAALPAGASWNNGELDISGSNVTISGLDIDGAVRITGPNATVKDSFIHGDGDPEVLVYENANDTLMTNDEVTAPASTIGAINNAGGMPMKVANSYLHDNCTGTLGLGDYDNNYMITDGIVAGCHVEDGYVPGGNQGINWAASPWGPAGPSYTSYVHNTLLNPLGQTASIFLDNHAWGPNANVTENDNLMAGGDYVTYGDTDGDGSTNITIINNRFSRLYFSDGGYYGADVLNTAATNFSGNIWDDTLSPVQPNS